MFSKPMMLRIASAIVLGMLLVGCGAAPTELPTYTPQPTENIQPTLAAVQTQAIRTFVANLTKNAPTATTAPTKTVPPPPTATLPPTVPPTPAATATNVPPAKPTALPAMHCTIKSVYPSESNTFAAGESIKPVVVLVNTGSTTWTASGFTFTYWSGARFEGQLKLNLPEDTSPNSDITMGLSNWTAPKTAGTYKAVWAVISGFTPYCTVGITVVVK